MNTLPHRAPFARVLVRLRQALRVVGRDPGSPLPDFLSLTPDRSGSCATGSAGMLAAGREAADEQP